MKTILTCKHEYIYYANYEKLQQQINSNTLPLLSTPLLRYELVTTKDFDTPLHAFCRGHPQQPYLLQALEEKIHNDI